MTLTNESFRDPRKLYRLRVKSPFFITGQKEPTKVGEVVSLPKSAAAEVVHSNKAIWLEGDAPAATPGMAQSPILRAQPPLTPEQEPKPDAKASSKTAKE